MNAAFIITWIDRITFAAQLLYTLASHIDFVKLVELEKQWYAKAQELLTISEQIIKEGTAMAATIKKGTKSK